MNTTMPTGSVAAAAAAAEMRMTLGSAFFGFSIGAILFGITIRQAYQYYSTNVKDKILRKFIIGVVCFLDTLHLIFSTYVVYSFLLEISGYSSSNSQTILSLKALGSTQVPLVLIVQGFYLSQIWRMSQSLLLSRKFALAVHIFVVVISIFSIGVAIIFVFQLQHIEVVYNFNHGFEYVVYLGFGSTAIVDCAISTAMCIILHKSSTGTERGESVVEILIQYFVGSGLLTSFAAILCIVLYVAQPNTLLFLGMELSVSRLYANSLLAMFNARRHIHDKMTKTLDLRLPSHIFFDDPEQRLSLISSRSSGNQFSPGQETKFSRSPRNSMRKGKEKSSPEPAHTL